MKVLRSGKAEPNTRPGRALRLVGIFEKQAVLDELVDRLAADGFAGVGRVANFVLVAHPVHHLSDSAERSGSTFPRFARLDVGEGEKREGGAFVLLFPRNANYLEKLECLADSCGRCGAHEAVNVGAPRCSDMARSMAICWVSSKVAFPSRSKADRSG